MIKFSTYLVHLYTSTIIAGELFPSHAFGDRHLSASVLQLADTFVYLPMVSETNQMKMKNKCLKIDSFFSITFQVDKRPEELNHLQLEVQTDQFHRMIPISMSWLEANSRCGFFQDLSSVPSCSCIHQWSTGCQKTLPWSWYLLGRSPSLSSSCGWQSGKPHKT